MSVIMVTYDLHKPGDKGYDALYDYLRAYDCRHPVESVWFLDTSKPTETIMDDIVKILPYPDHDMLIVIRQKKKGWVTYGTPRLAEWFKDPKRTWDL
ncbi:hypothetical protein [Acetobacter ghanensis]|uniref:CRISPR-associated protein Cas2 n=1 Tax=Acetobacter ghanensis TaxID=431306 RepID=A0ABX0KHD1_9PROT|nr:hypothetical protein [Acetobacter ghanensis]NHO39477.1 hypothetical protein [Acetobacter ghanensis]GBQ46381.1 hypothetical protein AA18895_0746 [Acetobacter ghanensis DSM 18895]